MTTFSHEFFCSVSAICVLKTCCVSFAAYRTKNESERVLLGGKESRHGNSRWVLNIACKGSFEWSCLRISMMGQGLLPEKCPSVWKAGASWAGPNTSWEAAPILGPPLSSTKCWGSLGSHPSTPKIPSSFPAEKWFRFFWNLHWNLTVPRKAVLTAHDHSSVYFPMMTKCRRQQLVVFRTIKPSQVLMGIGSCISNNIAMRTTNTACFQTRTLLHNLFLINRERATVITLCLVWIFS